MAIAKMMTRTITTISRPRTGPMVDCKCQTRPNAINLRPESGRNALHLVKNRPTVYQMCLKLMAFQTRPSTSPYPWQEPHGSPFVETIFFLVNGKELSLAFSAHESQLFPFSPFEQVPDPSQWPHSMAI